MKYNQLLIIFVGIILAYWLWSHYANFIKTKIALERAVGVNESLVKERENVVEGARELQQRNDVANREQIELAKAAAVTESRYQAIPESGKGETCKIDCDFPDVEKVRKQCENPDCKYPGAILKEGEFYCNEDCSIK